MKTAQECLALNLKRLRKEKGFTQCSLAEAIDISHRSYQKYEQMEAFPDDKNLDELARALGVPLTELFSVAEGGHIPAEHASDAALAGLKQLIKGKQTRDAAQMMSARGKATNLKANPLTPLIEAAPDELPLGLVLRFLQEFANAPAGIRAATLGVLVNDRSIVKPYLRPSKAPKSQETK